jgi:glycerol uptake facilitator protein
MKFFLGELIGTFVLVFIGLFSVYGAVIEGWFNLYMVASIWVVAVFLGIVSSRKWSPAHLNPAVTFGFLASGERMSIREVVILLLGQFIGAFLAAFGIFILFNQGITDFELSNGIIRGDVESLKTAMVFGEFYPNPAGDLEPVPTWLAALLEGGGTFVLMSSILICVEKIKSKNILALIIALTVGVLIVFIAPHTQAGFNPARDLLPRIVSSIVGWKSVVWSLDTFSPILVYVIAPIFGAALAGMMKLMVQWFGIKKGLKRE